MGRALIDQRKTNGVTKSTVYTYNLDGSVATLTYPSGRVVTYAYDAASRPLSAVDQANTINYALSATYAPQGALASLVLGSSGSFAGINLNESFNSRLQPSNIKAWSTTSTALDVTYGFVDASSHNNGNVVSIANNRDTNCSQSFSYDQLSRILSAQTQGTTGPNCWGLSFSYDIWANLTAASVTQCSAPMLSLTVNSNNRITNTAFSYELAGNMTGDGSFSYTWNAESQIKAAAGVTYSYDGDGNRVQKSNGKLYWYGVGSEVLDESDLAGNFTDEYVFFGGKRIARQDSSGNIYYYMEDFLGPSRVITQANGTLCYEADFYPFGGERAITNTCPQNYKFTGKERDAETGLDDFGARLYSSGLGRWLSPDWSTIPAPVPYADLTNPQTLNLYQFVRNNPETFVDLDGHDPAARNSSKGIETTIPPCSDATGGPGCPGAGPSQELMQQETNKQQQVADTAQKYDGSKDWAFTAQKGAFACNTNKCNAFVGDVTKEAGASVSVTGSDGKSRYPLAGELADKNTKIVNWPELGPGQKPQPGDIAAYKLPGGGTSFSGHSGIVTSVDRNGTVHAMAAHEKVVGPDNKFNPGVGAAVITYRRFTGDQ